MNTFKQFILENDTYRELYRKPHSGPKTPKKLYTIFNKHKVWSEKIYAHSPAQAIRFFKRSHSEYDHLNLDAKEYIKPVTTPVVTPVEPKPKPKPVEQLKLNI
jgi:hypothetical protein